MIVPATRTSPESNSSSFSVWRPRRCHMDGVIALLPFLALFAAGLPSPASANGCFWTTTCSNKWIGGCGLDRIKVDQSDDCQGLCPAPRYPPCPPFSTHVLCCTEETPVESEKCARFENKVDAGSYWLCCSDGTQATLSNVELNTGYCRSSAASLNIQLKSQEVFKWMVRDWTECSTRCGHGLRHRAVHCVGSLEYSPKQLYYVNETKCDVSKKPSRVEPCNEKRCSRDELRRQKHMKHHHRHRRGPPLWAKVLISGVTMIAAAGLAFGGYVFYKRRMENISNHGCVYVALGNYA